jgi:creatinine amidohydrolase
MNTKLSTRRLEELNWMEFKRLVPDSVDTVLVPVGTIEAHGVTGLGTDIQVPASICGRIAGSVNALIAPGVNYGITRSLLPYPGSITVTPDTFERYVSELCCGLADAGFRRIVLMNGHGGNTEALKNVSFRVYRERKTFSMVVDWWTLCGDEVQRIYGHAGGHAGTDETAMVQIDHPEDIRQQDYSNNLAFTVQPGLAAVPFPGSIILYKQNEGCPDFDPAKARELMDAVCTKIAKTLTDVFERWARIR